MWSHLISLHNVIKMYFAFFLFALVLVLATATWLKMLPLSRDIYVLSLSFSLSGCEPRNGRRKKTKTWMTSIKSTRSHTDMWCGLFIIFVLLLYCQLLALRISVSRLFIFHCVVSLMIPDKRLSFISFWLRCFQSASNCNMLYYPWIPEEPQTQSSMQMKMVYNQIWLINKRCVASENYIINRRRITMFIQAMSKWNIDKVKVSRLMSGKGVYVGCLVSHACMPTVATTSNDTTTMKEKGFLFIFSWITIENLLYFY